MWYLHTVEYYSALTIRAILTHAATTWMNLEDTLLNEISPSRTHTRWRLPGTEERTGEFC